MVDYLTDYARSSTCRWSWQPVRSVRPADGGYLVEADGRAYEADQVVIATGPFQVPRVPAIAGGLDADVVQFHSSGYRTPGDLPPGPVLVVGGGNTGFQIAEELSPAHEVHLSIGSRQTPLPQRHSRPRPLQVPRQDRAAGKTVDTRLGRRLKERDTLIGSSPRRARRKHGVTLRPRAIGGAGARWLRGRHDLEVDSVIWATGFASTTRWSTRRSSTTTARCHQRGVTDVTGPLLPRASWLHTRGSALLGWVKDDAEYLAERIRAQPTHAPARCGTRNSAQRRTSMNDNFPTATTGLLEAHVPKWSSSPTATASSCASRRSPSASARQVRMLAYNGSIPGPTLRVQQGSEITVDVRNDADTEATVHWHGLRLDNPYDGRTRPRSRSPSAAVTPPLRFPDPGLYWYHPHIREDYGHDMGLYGNIVVDPSDPDYWPPVHRELLLTLDDVLIEDGQVAPFNLDGDHPRRRWAASATSCSPPARPSSSLSTPARRGRPPLLHQHRQHPPLQGRAPGRPDEADRRRQRPQRTRDVRRRGPARAVGAGHRRRPVRASRVS